MPTAPLPDIGKDAQKLSPRTEKFLKDMESIKKRWDDIQKQIDAAKAHPAYRIAIDRNINPEVTNLMGKVPAFRKPVKDGKMNFSTEIPGFNSNRWYFGMRYDF